MGVAAVHPAQAVDLLAEAVDVLAGSGARLEEAKALVEYGRALRLARRPAEAREPLAAGRELANRCAASGLAKLARTELMSAGARPRRLAVTGVDALTPSERRVSSLAAGGQTNRAIAQHRFISERTVENHLGRAFAKLGVASRGDLPAEQLTG